MKSKTITKSLTFMAKNYVYVIFRKKTWVSRNCHGQNGKWFRTVWIHISDAGRITFPESLSHLIIYLQSGQAVCLKISNRSYPKKFAHWYHLKIEIISERQGDNKYHYEFVSNGQLLIIADVSSLVNLNLPVARDLGWKDAQKGS